MATLINVRSPKGSRAAPLHAMARKRNHKRSLSCNSKPKETTVGGDKKRGGENAITDSAHTDQEIGVKKEKETPQSSLALVVASTSCERCKTVGSLVQATISSGEITCCAYCGEQCVRKVTKRIESKRRKIDRVLAVDDGKMNEGDIEDGSDMELTEDQLL